MPQVRRAVNIPVIAAGGIADGAGMAAAFCLGAAGVQCGTVFIASAECTVHQNYKDMIVSAGDLATVVTGRSTGLPVRSLKNPLSRKLAEIEKQGVTAEELETLTIGSLKKAAKDGDEENGSFMAGQIAGLIESVRPCRDIIIDMVRGAKEIIDMLAR